MIYFVSVVKRIEKVRTFVSDKTNTMKNLLQIANEKKAKLESTQSVKLSATNNDGVVVLSENGTIVPASEVQKIEGNHVFVSGSFAAQVSFKEALRLNKI